MTQDDGGWMERRGEVIRMGWVEEGEGEDDEALEKEEGE